MKDLKYKPIFSVDVEDWLQSTWNRDSKLSSVSEKNMILLLDRLDRLDIKITMFILGKYADTFPHIVRKISDAGHEIASHGHGHLEIFTQSRKHFRKDIRRNKDYLEQLTGKEVIGYRAPDFSIIDKSIWALDELAETGFIYDSSIFPINGSRYGIEDCSLSPHSIDLKNGKSIIEFPITAYPIGGKNRPISGGGYFRLFPSPIMYKLMEKVLKERPFVSYMHPYEFNKDEFRDMEVDIPFHVKFHQGLFRNRFGLRFDSYVKRFGNTTFSDFIKENNLLIV